MAAEIFAGTGAVCDCALALPLLLFRLMFMSGAVKLLSADASWWKLTRADVSL